MTEETKPMPDPTVLTTEQLLREVENATKLMEGRIKSVEDMCEQRFVQVKEQFRLVENQRVEQKKDTQDAVDAAFSASKEAVKEQTTASDRAIAKSEASMLEQLKQLSATFTTQIKGVTDKTDDLKDRVGSIESVKQGGKEATSERRESLAGVYVLAGLVISLLGLVVILAAAGVFN